MGGASYIRLLSPPQTGSYSNAMAQPRLGVAQLLEKLNSCVDKSEFDRWLFFLGSKLSRETEAATAAAGGLGKMSVNYFNAQTVSFEM